MKFLVDTDIILFGGLSPGADAENHAGIHPYSAASFNRLARKNSCSILVHPLSLGEVEIKYQGEGADVIKAQIKGYELVDQPSPLSVFGQNQVGFPKTGSSDYVDTSFLAVLKADLADFLVTEKVSVHSRAQRLGLSTRVLFLSDALFLLKDLFDSLIIGRPRVEEFCFSLINKKDPIFWILANHKNEVAEYEEKNLNAFVIQDAERSSIAGICVVEKREKILYIRFLHVAPQYPVSRYEALLLKAVFDHAQDRESEKISFSAFPGNEKFIALAQFFGFNGGVASSVQSVLFHDNNSWVLPLSPLCHEALFPELEIQLPIFGDMVFQGGNAIQKVCFFNRSTARLTPGDNLFVYRTKGPSGITGMGVVEDTIFASNPGELVRFLGTRTVWSYGEIVNLCKKNPLVIKFRYIRSFRSLLGLSTLKEHGVLRGSPRVVTKLNKEGGAWLHKIL